MREFKVLNNRLFKEEVLYAQEILLDEFLRRSIILDFDCVLLGSQSLTRPGIRDEYKISRNTPTDRSNRFLNRLFSCL